MEMCYDGTLVMPSSYAVMSEDEMMYVDGGIAVSTVCTIIATTIAVSGACYNAGAIVGKRLYYAGINTSKKWAKYKWQARATAISSASMLGLAGTAAASIFMLGLENKLYDMM